MKVAITGAAGFIGQALVRHLAEDGHEIVPIVRKTVGLPGEVVVDDIRHVGPLRPMLKGCDAIVHLAARAHVLRETSADPVAEFREVNADATIRLAEAAVAMGVRRFVFLSTIGVNGTRTMPGRPFAADGPPNPQGPYALAKWQAEQGLRDLERVSGLEVVIIRPPLVYGVGAKGRFAMLARWIRRGRPLPFGLLRNKRHFVSVRNLADFVGLTLVHPSAAGETFLVSDAESVSTRDFAALLASKMGARARFLPVPPRLMMVIARLLGKEQAATGLLASLELSLEKNAEKLGWTPPFTLAQGMENACKSDAGPASPPGG